MAQPKHLGGLGFKNLEDYNDSLLAKLSWRIHSNPDSMLTQVLKGNIFMIAPLWRVARNQDLHMAGRALWLRKLF